MNKIGKRTYKVCFMGASMGTGNRGVSALAASVVNIIKSFKPEAELSFFIGNRSSRPQEVKLLKNIVQVKVVNYRLSPKARLHEHLFWIFLMACLQRFIPVKSMREKIIRTNAFLHAMHQSDFVGDINGGDSFSDIYGIRRFIIGTMPAVIALLLNKNLTLLPQTYGPFGSKLSKYIARFILNRAAFILSRDRESIKLIQSLTRNRALKYEVMFCPDVAFMLDSIKPDQIDIQPPIDTNESAPKIGLNLNGLMYSGGYTQDNMFGLKFNYNEFVYKLVLKILESTESHILLVPHTFGPPGNINSDPDACRNMLDSLPNLYKDRVHMVMGEYDQSQLKGIINTCDFFIGSRMHACIAALSQGIPTIGIAYSKKFIGVFDSIGSGDTVVDARTSDEETAIRKIMQCFEKRNEIGVDAEVKILEAKTRIGDIFEKLISEHH